MKYKKLNRTQLEFLAESLKDKQVMYLTEADVPGQQPVQPAAPAAQQQQNAQVQQQNTINPAQKDTDFEEKFKVLCKGFGQGAFDANLNANSAKQLYQQYKCDAQLLLRLLTTVARFPETARKHPNGISNVFKMLQILKTQVGSDIKSDLKKAGVDIPQLKENINENNENLIVKAGRQMINEKLNAELLKLSSISEGIESNYNFGTESIKESVKQKLYRNNILQRIEDYYALNRSIRHNYALMERLKVDMKGFDSYMKASDDANRRLNEDLSAAKYAIRMAKSKNEL